MSLHTGRNVTINNPVLHCIPEDGQIMFIFHWTWSNINTKWPPLGLCNKNHFTQFTKESLLYCSELNQRTPQRRRPPSPYPQYLSRNEVLRRKILKLSQALLTVFLPHCEARCLDPLSRCLSPRMWPQPRATSLRTTAWNESSWWASSRWAGRNRLPSR